MIKVIVALALIDLIIIYSCIIIAKKADEKIEKIFGNIVDSTR